MSEVSGGLFIPADVRAHFDTLPSFVPPERPDVRVFLDGPEPCEACGRETLVAVDTDTDRPLMWENESREEGRILGPEHTPERCRAPS